MSNKALTWAWSQHHVKGNCKNVLTRLCDEAREPDFAIGRTAASTLTVADIVLDCGIKRSTVLAALKTLREEDLIEMHKGQGASEILINHPDAPHMRDRAGQEPDSAQRSRSWTSETSRSWTSDVQILDLPRPDPGPPAPDVLSYTQITQSPSQVPHVAEASEGAVCLTGSAPATTAPAAARTEVCDPPQLPGEFGVVTAGEELVRELKVPSRWVITPQVVKGCGPYADRWLANGWPAAELAKFWEGECGQWKPRPGAGDHPMKFLTALIKNNTPETPPKSVLEQSERTKGKRVHPRPDCTLCDDYGWVLGADGKPIEPVKACKCPTDPTEIGQLAAAAYGGAFTESTDASERPAVSEAARQAAMAAAQSKGVHQKPAYARSSSKAV
jgi:hypothetical protein